MGFCAEKRSIDRGSSEHRLTVRQSGRGGFWSARKVPTNPGWGRRARSTFCQSDRGWGSAAQRGSEGLIALPPCAVAPLPNRHEGPDTSRVTGLPAIEVFVFEKSEPLVGRDLAGCTPT